MISSILWTGEKRDDTEFRFPLNIIAAFFMPERTIESRSTEIPALAKHAIDEPFPTPFGKASEDLLGTELTALTKDAIDEPLQTEVRLPAEDRLAGSFISDISINDLYNFMTFPQGIAGNLFLAAGFVSVVTTNIPNINYIKKGIKIP